MSQDLLESYNKLWRDFKNVNPDSEVNINKKSEILSKINEVGQALGKPIWSKWNKEDALKQLKTKSGNMGTKLENIDQFHDVVKQLWEQEKTESQTFEHWRLDNLAYLDLLVRVFNRQ